MIWRFNILVYLHLVPPPQVRGRTISERESLRTPGPAWEEAFFVYLRELDCPCLLNASDQQGDQLFGAVQTAASVRCICHALNDKVDILNVIARAVSQVTCTPAGAEVVSSILVSRICVLSSVTESVGTRESKIQPLLDEL